MSFDYALLGKKLKEARESLLIKPSEAANFLQIDEQNYLALESGQEKVTGDQILILADLYQRDFRYFVTGDYPSAESQIQELFRQNADLSKQDRMAIQEFIKLCEYEYFLEQQIFNKKTDQQIPNYSDQSQYNLTKSHYFKGHGIEAAKLERQRLQLGISPIQDIFEIIRSQGIHVFKRQLEDKNISGLYIKHPQAGHCILINYVDDLYRQNFSAAHEYCHVLFDSELEEEITYFNEKNNTLDEKKQKREWRANSFGGNFLVPKEILEKKYSLTQNQQECRDIIKNICSIFKVNYQVALIRLNDIGWIDNDLKDKLMKDKSLVVKAKDKFDPEIPEDLSPGTKERLTKVIRQGLSWHFIQLATEAYRQGEITYHKLLEMLLLPLEEGIQLLKDLSTFVEVAE